MSAETLAEALGVERMCEVMHDAYEAAATREGWETQERSRKPWAEVPEANKATMRAAVRALLAALIASGAVRPAAEVQAEVAHAEVVRAHERVQAQTSRTVDWRSFDAGYRVALAGESGRRSHRDPDGTRCTLRWEMDAVEVRDLAQPDAES